MAEQRQNFTRDYRLNYYSVTDLAEQSRRPHGCPWQTSQKISEELKRLRSEHPGGGPRKLLNLIERKHRTWHLPAVSTAAKILKDAGMVQPKGRGRRAHTGCPKYRAKEPNEIWAADYKGQFRLKDGRYCYPLTVSDLYSRYLLGCDGHEAISIEKTKQYFTWLFGEYGLPARIRTDNGVPFASSAPARLSALSVWWIKPGICPELIEPGKPQQNGIHERMHGTLKAEATIPASANMRSQQRRFDEFRTMFNEERPHEALGMRRPAEVYHCSGRQMPKRLEIYDYPAHYLVRRVSRAGAIRIENKQIFVTTTLKEDYVGLEAVDDGVYDLVFCFYHIGRYDVRTNRITGIISKVSLSRSRDLEAPKVLPMSPE